MVPNKEINQVAEQYPEIFEFLASKQRSRREPMRLASLAKHSHTSKERVYGLVKILEQLGIGVILKSARGMPIRFVWKYSPISVGKAGIINTPLKTFSFTNRNKQSLPNIEIALDNRNTDDYATINMNGISIRGPKKRVLEILSKI